MKITLVSISARRERSKSEAVDRLVADYVQRASRYCPVSAEISLTEDAFWAGLERAGGREPATVVLFDSTGIDATSLQWADRVCRFRDGGCQRLVFAIGPADGWSQAAFERAGLVLSLGRLTLPHELARVVVAEQIYRALTILAGHPYHGGH